jgi:hypothetical protein
MVASMVGSVTCRKVDDAAWDIGVLVVVVTGADPVVTVRDLRGPVGGDTAAHEQDRRNRLGLPNLLQVRGDMRVIGWQQGETRGPQNVLGFSMNVLGPAKSFNQHSDEAGPGNQPQVVTCRRIVVLLRLGQSTDNGHLKPPACVMAPHGWREGLANSSVVDRDATRRSRLVLLGGRRKICFSAQ